VTACLAGSLQSEDIIWGVALAEKRIGADFLGFLLLVIARNFPGAAERFPAQGIVHGLDTFSSFATRPLFRACRTPCCTELFSQEEIVRSSCDASTLANAESS
jgi:hypothetical protein